DLMRRLFVAASLAALTISAVAVLSASAKPATRTTRIMHLKLVVTSHKSASALSYQTGELRSGGRLR
ncbi:MAG: hypothetical protein M3016_05065, partial [Actinomycetota bacterium]|nr:hypothetical protein [Actinomycetota bacterium]